MSLLNRQVGRQITARLPPELEGFEIVGKTWKPRSTTETIETRGAANSLINVGFENPGAMVDCQLVQYVTDPVTEDLVVGQVIDEVATASNPVPQSWLVMKADPVEYGPARIVFDVTLKQGDDLDLSVVTPA